MKDRNVYYALAGVIGLAATAFLHIAAAASESGNLISVTDSARCTVDTAASTTVPGWITIEGSPSLLCPSIGGFTTPGSAAIDAGLIGSGPYGVSTLERIIDVSGAAAAIDHAAVAFTLSGWLGGSGSAGVNLTMIFRDRAGRAIGAPVQLAGAAAVSGRTGAVLDARSAGGLLPASTRSLRVVLSFVNTSGPQDIGYADRLSLTLRPPLEPPLPPPPPPLSSVPLFDHVFLIVMENTDYEKVVGDTADAPFINELIRRGTLLAQYSAVYHPSDQNYLAIAGGDTAVRGAIYFPNIHLTARHLGDTIEAAGKSWKAYEQGMGTPCNTTTKYDKYYEPDDAPFVNYTNVIGNMKRCRAHLLDVAHLRADLRSATTTPNFSWIAADDYYDGEASGNGSRVSLRVQDGWLKRILTPVFTSPAWRKERSLLILTWDESLSECANHIATILAGSQGSVRAGFVSKTRYDHYSTARTIEEALGLPSLTSNDAYARPINDAFARAEDGTP